MVVRLVETENRFRSVEGWVELGMFDEAAEELNNLPPALKSSVAFCKLWVRIYAATKAWSNVELMCQALLAHAPGDPSTVLHAAEAQKARAEKPEATKLDVWHFVTQSELT